MPRRNFDASMVARLREDQAQAAYLRRQRLVTAPPVSSGTNNILLNPQTTNYNSSSQTQAQNGMETTYINGSLRNVYNVGCICDFNEMLPTPPIPPVPPTPPIPDVSEGTALWATSQSSSNFAYTRTIQVDNFGNIYMLLFFMGTITINDYISDATSPITVSSYGTFTNSDQTDTCLVKYNASGQVQWATTITGIAQEFGSSLAFDSVGNVYVTGTLGSNISTFNNFVSGGGGGAISVSPYGTLTRQAGIFSYTFLAKYNPNGVVQWVTQIVATNRLFGQYITIDASDMIYVSCFKSFLSSTTISIYNQGGIIAGNIIPTLYGSIATTLNLEATVLVKYNTNGVALWGTKIENDGNSENKKIAVAPDGSIYISGVVLLIGSPFSVYFYSLAASPPPFINTALSATLTYNGAQYAYLAKYDTNGGFVWATNILLSTGIISPNDNLQIATDSVNNVYIVGSNPGTVDINNFSSVTAGNVNTTLYGSLQVTTGSHDAYLVKYNSSGVAQWGTRLTNSTALYATGFAIDAANNLFVSGVFDSPITIDSFVSDSGGGVLNTTSFGILPQYAATNTYFLVKYNSQGVGQWATNGTGSGNSPADLVVVSCSGSSYVYLASIFLPVQFDINDCVSVSGGTVNTVLYNNLAHAGDSYNSALVKYIS